LLELASCKALLYAPGSLAAPVNGGQHVNMRTQQLSTSNPLSVAIVMVTSAQFLDYSWIEARPGVHNLSVKMLSLLVNCSLPMRLAPLYYITEL
jgi:hypothetical protein